MADAPNPDSPVTASPPPSSPTGVTRRFPAPDGVTAAPLLSGEQSDVVYRPLSTAAVAGFCIAALYTVVIVLGSVVSWIGGTPWLVGGWSMLFPVVAAGLCLAGWFTVHTSEGTRTGKSLAVWGLTLALISSVGYWSYYSVTYLLIRRDAEAFCLKWFDKIRDGKIEAAFLDTLQPKHRPREDGNLRDAIEMRFNVEAPQTGRPSSSHYAKYKQHLILFALTQGGSEVEITPLGVTAWEYGSGGYSVFERFRISTPDYRYEGVVKLNSSENQSKQRGDRGWYISLMETTNHPAALTPTEEGQKKIALQRHAATFFQEWQSRLRSLEFGDTIRTYLSTLDPVQREEVIAKYQKAEAPTAAAMVLTGTGDGWSGFVAATFGAQLPENVLPGLQDYLRGSLVQLAPDFWPPDEETRTKDLQEARQLFHGVTDMPMGVLHADADRLGTWKLENGRFKVRHAVDFRLRNLIPGLEAAAYLECDANVLKTGPSDKCWKITRIDLLSQHVVPANASGGMPGRRPGSEEP